MFLSVWKSLHRMLYMVVFAWPSSVCYASSYIIWLYIDCSL